MEYRYEWFCKNCMRRADQDLDGGIIYAMVIQCILGQHNELSPNCSGFRGSMKKGMPVDYTGWRIHYDTADYQRTGDD